MSKKYTLSVTAGDELLPVVSGKPRESMKRLAGQFQKLASGANTSTFAVAARNTGVPATGTLTLATCTAGTVIEVNGVDFLAIASGTPTVANGEFVISGTDAADATSLVAAINGSTNARISGVLTASSTGSTGVVTIAPVQAGYLGNAISIKTKGNKAKGTVTIAAIQANDTVTLNGTTLTSKQQRATGTLTAATAIAGTTFVLNGMTFTGVAGAATLGEPEFSIDTGNTETATSIAAQINGYGSFSGVVTATSASDVVTIRAVTAGTAGNDITLVGTVTVLAASAATLTGGIAVANNEFEAIGTNTQIATDLVRCIGASSTALVSSHVDAVSTAAVVTIYAKYDGTPGNGITLASSDGTRLALSVTNGRLAGGSELTLNGAQASGTLTLASVLNTHTCVVNGVTLTAHTDTDANDQFRIDGADDTADALSLRNAINNSTTAALADVIATAAAAVVTVKSRRGGIAGNVITLSAGQGTIVASAARLTTGAVPTEVVLSGARLASGSEDAVVTFNF